jgi:hypothetical protein
MFDFGILRNLQRYGNIQPPSYDLSAVTAPVYLYYADNDWMAAVEDVNELAGKLGNVVKKIRIPYEKFNHLDFLYASDADSLLYRKIIENIKEHN